MAISDYSNTAASNTTVSGINIAEGCSPAGINNALRQIMADIKDFYDVVPTFSDPQTVSAAWTYTATQKFNDNVSLVFGTGSDTSIIHNGTNTILADASAGLIVKTASFKVQNAAGTEDMIEAVEDSFVKLRHNNTARLTTTSSGVTVTGLFSADTFGGAGVSTDINADTGSTTKVPHVAAVEAEIAAQLAGATSRVLLATKTASNSATLDFTELNNATYSRYVFVFESLIPATDSVSLYMRTSTDGGSNYDATASDYDYVVIGYGGGTQTSAAGSSATEIQLNGGLTIGSAANEFGVNGELTLYNAASASIYTSVVGQVGYINNAGRPTTVQVMGTRLAASDVDAVRFLFSSGNAESGTIKLYGII